LYVGGLERGQGRFRLRRFSSWIRERESEGNGGAPVGAGTGGGGVAAVLTGYGADQEEAKAGAFDLGDVTTRNSVEAFEDALELVCGETDASVGDAECDRGGIDDGEGAADVDAFGGVLDGVVEEVEDGGAEVFGDADGVGADDSGDGFEEDAFGREVVALECDGDAVGEEGDEVDGGAVSLAMVLA
jgi:hypothetical protein